MTKLRTRPMSHARDFTSSPTVIITKRACGCWSRSRIIARVTGVTASTSRKSFGSNYSPAVSGASRFNSCRWSGAQNEICSIFLWRRRPAMTDATTYWCVVVFRCVNCGRNEAFAEESSVVEPREEQVRTKTYQAICRYCGWQGEARGISAIEMRSGVERRTRTRGKE